MRNSAPGVETSVAAGSAQKIDLVPTHTFTPRMVVALLNDVSKRPKASAMYIHRKESTLEDTQENPKTGSLFTLEVALPAILVCHLLPTEGFQAVANAVA
jgi:hypothetical protein